MSKQKPFPYAAAGQIDSVLEDLSDIERIVGKISECRDMVDVLRLALKLSCKLSECVKVLKQVRAMRPE